MPTRLHADFAPPGFAERPPGPLACPDYTARVLDLQPRAYWPGHTTGNTLTDATLQHPATLQATPQATPGPVLRSDAPALACDGNTQRATCNTLNLQGFNGLTFLAWARLDASTLSRDHGLITRSNGNDAAYLWLDATEFGTLTPRTATFYLVNVGRAHGPADLITPHTWHCLAGVFRPGDAIELWHNGSLAGSAPTPATTFSGANDPIHLASFTGTNPLQGGTAHLAIFDHALPPADLAALYHAARANSPMTP